jgi:hypothetical protein
VSPTNFLATFKPCVALLQTEAVHGLRRTNVLPQVIVVPLMGDPQLDQEPALETNKAAQPVFDKPDICDDSSTSPLPREHTLTVDQAMSSEVRAPEKPRDLHQTQAITKDVVSRTLKGKEKEWAAVAEKKRPLQLLDLPVDILREIVGHVSSPIHLITLDNF